MEPPRKPGTTATVLVTLATLGLRPSAISRGKLMRVPPPATELIAPARNAMTAMPRAVSSSIGASMGDNPAMTRIDAGQALIAALRNCSFDALRDVLAADVAFVSAVTGPTSGSDAVIAQLQAFQGAKRY